MSDRALHPIMLVIRAGLIETIRRREFQVLLILMTLFFIGTVIVRFVGIENAATATFLMNLGLTMTFLFSQILAILSAARQFPDELESRTLYPLLAKPLLRDHYVIGKWAAVTVAALIAMVILFVMAWVPVPRMEQFSSIRLIQVVLLQALTVGMVAAVAQFLSFVAAKPVAISLSFLLLYAGGPLATMLRGRLGAAPGGEVVRWLTGYLPNLTVTDQLMAYTNGLGAEDLATFGARVLYALVWTVFPLALSATLLRRRVL